MFDITQAQTFDAERIFDVAEEGGHLVEEVTNGKYESVPAAVILQTGSTDWL